MPFARPTGLITAAAIILAGTIGARASVPRDQAPQAGAPAPQAPATKTLEDEEAFAIRAEETIEKVCSMCHPAEEITRTRRTLREWNDMVTTMVARGAVGTEEQFTTIKQYLTRYYGVVQVNTATAQELSAVFGLSQKDATAIVEYRKVNGKFANAAALAKVAGIDKSKIDEQPEALRFN